MYNKKNCLYCGCIATTKDHVPPKCFLDSPYPEQLKTVPACLQCNNSFSKDEEYVMYLSDYLLSIEFYNGEFTRKKSEATFNYTDTLEDRMINSLKAEENGVYFEVEYSRVINIINKMAIGLIYLNLGLKKEIARSNFIAIPQLTSSQKSEFDNINWKVIQEHRFKYFLSDSIVYFVINDVLLCVIRYV